MCVLFVYINPEAKDGGYRLILASNRDEFYKRPAKQAFRCPETCIIGGRDMEPGREGGMWLGLSHKDGILRVATLLNVTGEKSKLTPEAGRGPIVFNYLNFKQNDKSPLDYIDELKHVKFGPYNTFLLEMNKDGQAHGYHHSNAPVATHHYPGVQLLAFGNSTPEVPLTKVTNGRLRFEEIVNSHSVASREKLVEDLLQMLKDRERNLPDEELKRRSPVYEMLSSIYVEIEESYGTRTHTIMLVNSKNEIEFIEHTMREPIDVKNPIWDVQIIKSQL